MEVECKALSSNQAHFLQIWVEIPIEQPLRRGGQVVSPERDRIRVAYRYEQLVGVCFQCGKVGHDAIRCPHPYEGNTKPRPYGEWLHVGNQMALSKQRSTEGSPLRHNLAPTPQMSPRDPRDTKAPSLTTIDVTDNIVL